MKAKSCYSRQLDPYRAGIEIGESLLPIDPEVIFLFSTIHYAGSPEICEAIYDVTGKESLVIIGCSGDGCFERHEVLSPGVTALALNSEGVNAWHVAVESGVKTQPASATRRCMSHLLKQCAPQEPGFCFLTTDFRCDTSEIVAALSTTSSIPVFGGSAGDDNQIESSFVYANHQILEDTIAMLGVTGPIQFDFRLAHNLVGIGRQGKVTAIEGTSVQRINGMSAMTFIEREIGKPLDGVDQGVVNFRVERKDGQGEHVIRSLLLPRGNSDDETVNLFSAIEVGDLVQVCLSPPEALIGDANKVASSLGDLTFTPLAAVVTTCAGRQVVLGGDVGVEVAKIVDAQPSIKALAGFPSFGEFAPVKIPLGNSASLFHNMTMVILLIGEGEK